MACVWIEVSKSDELDTCIFYRAYNRLTSLQLMKMWLVIEIFQFILFTRGWPLHVRIYESISRQSLPVGRTYKKKVYQNVPEKCLIGNERWIRINYSPIPRRNIALQINDPYWIYFFHFWTSKLYYRRIRFVCVHKAIILSNWMILQYWTCISCRVEVSRWEHNSTILLNV